MGPVLGGGLDGGPEDDDDGGLGLGMLVCYINVWSSGDSAGYLV